MPHPEKGVMKKLPRSTGISNGPLHSLKVGVQKQAVAAFVLSVCMEKSKKINIWQVFEVQFYRQPS